MGRTACTEPQCLYKGELYLFIVYIVTTDIKGTANILHYLQQNYTLTKEC
jgi:hypothetical protein